MTTETAAADVPVTKLPMTAAAKKGASPVKVTKSTKRTVAAIAAPEPAPKAKATKAGATFTTVDLAKEQGVNAKTLRARIRRNIDKWEPLFAGERHTFADNATTRKAIDALLADA